MNQKKLDSKLKGAFEEMDDHDIVEAMKSKEDIWDSLKLDKKGKKKKKIGGWFWFCLGLLLAIAAMYLNSEVFKTEQNPKTPIAEIENSQQWESKLLAMESKISSLESEYKQSNDFIDSLNLANQILQKKLNKMISQNTYASVRSNEILVVTDTVYLTKYEKEIVEFEKIIRDTIVIEIPVIQKEEELFSEVGYRMEGSSKNNKTKENAKNKSKPSSIQFNFRKSKS